MKEMDYKDIISARKKVDLNPTEKQKKAGNYSMGHISIHGMQITIENPKGSYRSGKDGNGHEWRTLMHNDYGYFTKTVGKDGDAIDVFLGPDLKSTKVYPIDQFKGEEFDETKVMLGFNSAKEAKEAYLSNYDKNWKGFKYITEVDLDKFKKWLYDGYRQRKPFAKYVRLTEDKERQFNIIQGTNPMLDDYHVGIRSISNIKTFEEAMAEAREDYEEYGTYSSYPDTPNSVLEKALETGMITVYSSKPIVNGNFVSTSKMCARDYAGGGKVYSETLPVTDIAWINVEEGQVARMQQINEQWSRVYDLMEDYTHADLLEEFIRDKRNGITVKKWNTIPFEQYRNVRERFLQNPEMARIPLNLVMSWFDIIVHNTLSISYITDFAGHSQYFPEDDIMYVFSEQVDGFHDGCKFLESQGFYDWAKLPDGSDAWSDYGLSPLYKIIDEFSENMEAGQIMILIDRALDVGHCRGNLASAFIEGGSKSCSTVTGGGSLQESKRRKNDEGNEVPEKCECGGKVCVQIHGEPIFICNKCGKYYGTVPFVGESFNVVKALKNLKKRRDPSNIENWNKDMINEDFSSNILAKLAKEHGGIKISNNGGVRTFPCAFIYGHSVNPSEITDNMIVGEPFEYTPYSNDSDNAILFNDGMAVALRKDSELRRYSGDRKIARFKSGIGDTGDHDKTPDGFTGNEKKATSAPYNGWQSSERAGYSQSLRNAYKVNKEMGDNKTVDKIKAKARDLVAENTGRKIYLSESQFKTLCRKFLREKRNEDYAKKLLSEMAYGEADDIHGMLQKAKEYFKSEIDYLNNEGVVEYDFNNLRHNLNNFSNFKDLCSATLSDCGSQMPADVKSQLERYITTGSYPELEDTIMQAVREYVENGEQQGWMM